MNQFTDNDITTGIIEGGSIKEPTIIASVYLDIVKNDPVILPKFRELVEFSRLHNKRLICGIDANAHSSLWGCNEVNKRGEALEDFIFENNLMVQNIGNRITWQRGNFSSIIDITLSKNVGDEILDWHVSDIETFSDHRMIRFSLGDKLVERVLTRNYKKADWEKFQTYISSHLDSPPEEWCNEIVDKAIDHLNEVIDQALDIACPTHVVRKKDKIHFWNQDCENAKRHLIALSNKMRRRKTFDRATLNSVKSARRKLRKVVRRAKQESFQELVRETDSTPAMAKLNKILERKDAKQLGLVQNPNGSCTTSTTETLQVMFSEHFPGSENILDTSIRSSHEDVPRKIESLDWINNHRIRKAFAKFKAHKSPGPDNLKPLILHNLPEPAISYLRELYTACMQIEYTPPSWCHSRVLFMPKPGKKSYNLPRSFRPLSLSPFLHKGLERLAVWRIDETALTQVPLHPNQYAYRKNRSTENALTAVVNEIEKSLYRKKFVITIDLDIKGAFDNVSTEAVLSALERRKVDPIVVAWYGDYLRNRTCEATLGSSTVMAKLNKGGPQGGVATPTFTWNVPYDDLLRSYDGTAVKSFGFADDTKLIIPGVDIVHALETAQWALEVAEKWATKIGVAFSPEKTVAMFFNRGNLKKRKKGLMHDFTSPAESGANISYLRPSEKLIMNGKALEWSRECKYLGITIDDQLSFRQHISNKIAEAKRKLMLLRNVFCNSWGPCPQQALWAYTGIVRPALTYGSIVWAKAAQSDYCKKKLRSLQRLALIQVAHVRKSTPTAALELLYNTPPLEIYLWECAQKAACRIGISPNWVATETKGHQHFLYASLPTEAKGVLLDDNISDVIWTQNYEVKIGDGKDIKRRDFSCYTDGSKVGKKSGSGGIILTNKLPLRQFCSISFSMGGSSVFQAEVCAVLTAAKILLQNCITGSAIDFMVDSQASLMALNNPLTTSRLVKDTKLILNRLGVLNDIKLHYIEAHKGWKFNELADRNANKGNDSNRGNYLTCPSKRDIYSVIEEDANNKWSKLWDKEPGCRQSRFFIHGPAKAKAKELLGLARNTVGKLVRFLTGHAFLRRQNLIVLHGINPPIGDTTCRACDVVGEEETPHHLITYCEAFSSWRAQTLGQYELDEFPHWEPKSLARFLSHRDIILLESD